MAGKQMTKQDSQDIPNIQCAEDISLLDIPQLSTLAKCWNVDMSGLEEKKDIEDRLITFWTSNRKKEKSDSWEPLELASAFTEYQKTRQSLLEKYRKAEALYNNFTYKIKANLELSHPNVCTLIKEREDSFKSGECTIVIAGDIGAGKTSLLNLILETQIFPVNSLKCTNTILEIRSSEKKDAVFYYKQQMLNNDDRERKLQPKIISLKSLDGIQEFKDCVAEYDLLDDNPYDRCEVFYPFKTLSKGLVIVDTPGMEGGGNIDQQLQTYYSRAFGLIYVINTNAAYGFQQSRLGKLLKTVVNSSEDFSPEASLFIGNKWEHVPEGDRADVQEDIFYKLNQVYPGIQQTQIQYMSVKKSTEFKMKYETKLEEHNILMLKVSQLVSSSFRQVLVSNYWWLSSFLSRSLYLLRVTSVHKEMTSEELDRYFEDVRKRVEDLQQNTGEIIERLRIKVEYEIKRITTDIQNVLQNRAFLDRICNWEDTNECPRIERRWNIVADAAAVKMSERISRELDDWLRQNNILRVLDNEIIEVFKTELGLIDSQVKELEEYLVRSRGGNMCKVMCKVPVKALFPRKKTKVEKIYSTLGGAVSCIGMQGTYLRNARRIFRDFNHTTKAKKMSEATILYIDTILSHKEFGGKLRKFFDRYFKDIDEAAKRISEFVKADQQLIETLRTNIEEDDCVKEKLPGLVNESAELLGQLDIFYINDIMKFDFELSELEWNDKKELGSGSFTKVYKSKLTRKNRPVAIKVATDVVDQSNVTQILTEDRTMRDLKHANIVRYYGASYIKTKKGLQWIMVMELYQTTLKQIYTGSERNERMIPGCLGSDHPRFAEAAKYMLDHATQICTGLDYIHGKGYTHTNMKPEKVLLVEGNVIKITDVGVTNVSQILCKTADGSPAYMAPEVLLSNEIQTNKIDIYSFSLIFWEMWFGKDVADEINKGLLAYGYHGNAMEVLKSQIARTDGWRPPLSSPKRPPEMITDVLKRGWASDPEKRPSANEFGNTLKQFLKNNL